MDTYVSLVKFTEQGIKNIKESPARAGAFKRGVESAGGKLLGWYLTQGQYDVVTITQFPPDARAVMSLVLAIGAQGNVRTETMRAFTEAEFKDMVAALP